MNEIRITTYRSLNAAVPFLRKLIVHQAPWTFDIETYDAAAYPSRKKVSTSPSHPDFRVRGCAVAVSAVQGYWLEFLSRERAEPEALTLLSEAFGSEAEKSAFNGGFDENGLVLSGWVAAVRNRSRDGMLGMVALGDGTQKDFKLSNGITVLLKEQYHWGGADKALMRDLPIEEVADGAVRDACKTHAICDLIDEMAKKGEHIFWRRYGQKPKLWELMAREDLDPEWGEPDPEPPGPPLGEAIATMIATSMNMPSDEEDQYVK